MDDVDRRRPMPRRIPAALVLLLAWAQGADAQDLGDFQAHVQAAAPEASPPEKLGQPPENTTQQFLREDIVLLKPGDWQLDVGLNYTIADHDYTQLTVKKPGGTVTAVDTRLRRRLLVMPLAVRSGVTDQLQFFASLPVGWTNTETSTIGSDGYGNGGGIGDTSFGFTYLLHKGAGSFCDPDIYLTAGVTAPTSNSDYLANLLVSPQAQLGQGFWAGSWNLLFVQNYDPVLVFYGLGSRHTLAREMDGENVRAGDEFDYRLGVGFAVSDRVVLSGMLFGGYITDAQVNGQQLAGTNIEPVYLRFAVTLAQGKRICEPFVQIGMTSDAANTCFGITWTY